MSLDDATRKAHRAADRAVERVTAHADPEVLDYWFAVVWLAARTHSEFSTNTVFEIEARRPADERVGFFIEPRAMGGVMRRARDLGIIRKTDRVEPDRTPGAHARPKTIWRSQIWQER